MVFRPCYNITDDPDTVNSEVLLCVANMDWAALAWPLVPQGNGFLKLKADGKLEWHFVFRLDQYEAGVVEPILDGQIVINAIHEWQPVAMCAIGNFSSDLVFRELATIATQGFNITKPNSFKRNDLVWEIAVRSSGGNTQFADAVTAREAKTKKQKQHDDEKDAEYEAFAELILENLDKDEAVELKKDLKDGQKAKEVRKKKWQQMRKDGIDASWTEYIQVVMKWSGVVSGHCLSEFLIWPFSLFSQLSSKFYFMPSVLPGCSEKKQAKKIRAEAKFNKAKGKGKGSKGRGRGRGRGGRARGEERGKPQKPLHLKMLLKNHRLFEEG
eukprot:s3118_g11.t1